MHAGALLTTFSGRDVAAVLWAYASLEACKGSSGIVGVEIGTGIAALHCSKFLQVAVRFATTTLSPKLSGDLDRGPQGATHFSDLSKEAAHMSHVRADRRL